MNAKFTLVFCFLMLATAASTQTVTTNGKCSFQTITVPGEFSSSAEGINDIGAVVGGFSQSLRNPQTQGFLLFQGKFTTFSFPGAAATIANDINNNSQIVGSYSDNAGHEHGFIVHSGGFQTIDFPNAPNGTRPLAINRVGAIVGGLPGANGGERAFLLFNGRFTPFTFPGAVETEARGINDNSVITGTYRMVTGGPVHGFKVRNGQFATFDFPGALDTFLARENNKGELVGSYRASDGIHGFSFDQGRFSTIDDPDALAAAPPGTFINGLNNNDRITGGFTNNNIIGAKAFQANCESVF